MDAQKGANPLGGPMRDTTCRLVAVLALCAAAIGFAAPAAAQQAFYKGKTIRVIIGYGPGGGYDTYARLLTKHIGKHIPGNPTVLPQNMPGAGSTIAANHIFNAAPKDGTAFGTFARGLPLSALIDHSNKAIQFKPEKFTWIGSSSSYQDDAYLLLVRSDLPIKSVDDLRGENARQIVLAATNAGATSYDVPVQLLEVLGLKLKIIHGYPDGASMSLAVERREVDGRMIGLSSLQATQPEWLGNNGFMRPLLQFGRRTRHPLVQSIPTARELASGPENAALIELLEMPFYLARPYAAPPGVPADRAAILTKAFMATHKDKDYLADAKKQKMDVSAIDGNDIRDMLERMSNISPDTVERYLVIAAKTKPEGDASE
jgi:tripartite-type tricarboxylate transporter receptor subunit TctC